MEAPGGEGGATGPAGESGGSGEISPEWQAYFDCVAAATDDCMSPGFQPGDPALPAVVPETLAQMALDSATIALPRPHTSPDGVPQMTGLMTWFWIDPAAWAPISARAEVPGVWAEVTATPTRATWTPGDGGAAVTCDGPGRAHPGTAGATTDCGHTYVDIGSYPLTVDVTYEVSWDSSTGAGGVLDPIVVSGEVPITVEQRQAVID
ncbi:MAG TPA: hypothetical protein VK507_10755 [Iamia sp.]|nr:hypothetical protein [Iamia sp.]